MADPELQREAFAHNRPRGRWWRRCAAALGVAALSALVARITAWSVEREEVYWISAAPAVAREVPSPAPPAPPPIIITAGPATGGDLGPCPAGEPPRDPDVGLSELADAARAGRALSAHHVVGVTAARSRPGWLAAWTDEQTILLSTDDGRSFAPVLGAPGGVRDVAIDCHGRVFALREGGLLGVRQGAREGWQVIDSFLLSEAAWGRGPRLAADGGVLVLAGPATADINAGLLLASSDGGATWREHDLEVPGSWEGVVSLAVDRRGQVRVLSRWGDCRVEGASAHSLDPIRGRVRQIHDPAPYLRAAAITADGWIHAGDADCAGTGGLCAWTPRGAPRPVARPDLDPDGIACPEVEPEILAGDDFALARIGGHVLRLQRGRARALGDGALMDRALAVDHGGRLLGVRDGLLVRWSPRHGLRILAGQTIPEGA